MKKRYLSFLFPVFDLQLFADGDGGGSDGGDGDGSGDGNDDGGDDDTDGDDDDDDGDEGQLSFEDFLKQKGNQAEFDRRMQRAIKVAVSKAQAKWKTLTDDKLSEAEKLAKMSKDEKAEYLREKERREFEEEKAAFEREKLLVEVTKELQEQSLPIAFADSLAAISDAEKIKEAIADIKKSWDAEITEAIKAKARQNPPRESGHAVSGGNKLSGIGQMARASRIIK